MTQQERIKASAELGKAFEAAVEKALAITEKAQEHIQFLYHAKREEGKEINVVDAFNIDYYYEQIICVKCHIEKTPLFLVDINKNGTEEEFAFAFQRFNDLVEETKSNFEKIKHIISKIA